VALVRERITLTERPPLVGGQHKASSRSYSRFSRPEPLLFLPSSSSIVLMRLSGPRSIPTTSQKT
jgi:hypothetical protein